jgi:hypothetical protein
MSAGQLSPVQQRVVDELMARGQPRPTFAPELPIQLRDALEAGLAPVAERLGVGELYVRKRDLVQVHACEAHHAAEHQRGFPGWSASTARGTVAHKAIELAVFMKDELPPLELVDAAIQRFEDDLDDTWGPGEWLRHAPPVARAELRSEANERVVRFLESFPPLSPRWVPRLEAPVRIELCDGRIVVQAKADLVLGRAKGTEARVLIVDFKTGGTYPTHADDLRFYALLEAIRSGIPPFRVASYYLDSATFHPEDVDLDVLDVAVARTIAGVTKIAELHLADRDPAITPGPTCSFCAVRSTCEGAHRWEVTRGERGWST